MTTPRRSSARLSLGLFPIFLVGLALPLLAPTCGDFKPGVKSFSKGSLIIPMDVCYQCTRQSADGLDTATGNCTKVGYRSPVSNLPCPQALSQGDVIKAYGLVYQLIRNDVAVYWVIDPAKTAVDAHDLSIQFNAGVPVQKYDWAAGGPGAAPTADVIVRYMGGPFVVDGSDYAKAKAVLDAYRGTFSPVNVHVSNVAFQGYVAKTMAGGWGAGGAVAPKLALLDIGSGNLSKRTTAPGSTCDTSATASCVKDAKALPTDPDTWTCIGNAKNAEPVIREYLAKGGIGTGTAGGTATGPHGEIYDRLGIADFQPAAGSNDWKTSNFGKGGYQILWVPHWVGPGSCATFSSNCACLNSRYPAAQVEQVLKTVAAFSAAGGDLFAECAGLGTFEGAFPENNLTSASYSVDYQDGYTGSEAGWPASSRFQTKTGVRFNALPTNPFPTPSLTPDGLSNYSSPLMQLGDFPFKPYTGAIEDYKPDDTTATDRNYQPGVTRLIGAKATTGGKERDWDYFTFRAAAEAPDPRGTIVYLAGHSYSGVQGSFQAGGSRLVLNTLFNLGAGCTSSGVACDTGALGVCGRGTLSCDAAGNQFCKPPLGVPTTEICNGLDDDCDGLVDEDLEQACWTGTIDATTFEADPACQNAADPALRNRPENPACRTRGLCAKGVRSCQQNPDGSYGFSACIGETLPSPEVCNGLDDDCDTGLPGGGVDENLVQACYTGPDSTRSPQTGAPMGICKEGTQACTDGNWGDCQGQVLPAASQCDSPESGGTLVDSNCDGQLNTCLACQLGEQRSCYNGPAGTIGVGICHGGTQTCGAGGAWGTCQGEQVPQPEICNDGIDQDCDGAGNGNADDTAAGGCLSCAAGSTQDCWTGPDGVVFAAPGNKSVCERGKAACEQGEFGACGSAKRPVLPGPEVCNGLDDDCDGTADDGAKCGGGFECVNGVCVPWVCGTETSCLEGYDCIDPVRICVGTACHTEFRCKAVACGSLGRACDPGTLCVEGTCVDPNKGLTCGDGSAPAGGYCTGGACYEVGCPAGQVCAAGDCVPDACAGLLCPNGTFCRQGDCVQSCAFSACGAGQRCDLDGFCVADPCLGKSCPPSQICSDGLCVEDLCLQVGCGNNQVCRPGTCPCDPGECTGTKACAVCLDDPCIGVTCPAGLCRDGQCWPATLAASGGGGGEKDASGCGCGAGAASPLAFLGILLAVPLARRRRRGRGAALLPAALVVAGLSAAGCTKPATPFDPASCTVKDQPALVSCETEARCIDTNFDPSHCGGCGQACVAGSRCVDGVCGPASAVAPHISAVDPPTAERGGLAPQPVVLTGERFQDHATLRVTNAGGTFTVPTTLRNGKLEASLDLQVVPTGTWTLRVVNPDQVISNGRGFGVVFPTPRVTRVWPVPDADPGVSPPAVTVGDVRRLRLEGTGLMVDSTCWVGGGTLAEQEVAAELKAAAPPLPAGLECEVDLTRVAPGTYKVWVQNDATRLSGKADFRAVSAVPVLTSLAPASAVVGTTAPAIDLTGSGFDVTSKVVFRVTNGGTTTERDVPASYVNGGRLTVTGLDLLNCPGSGAACAESTATRRYFLLVKNGTDKVSQPVELFLLLSGAAPTVSNLSRGSGYQGETITLTISGNNIPSGTVMEARPPGGTFAALPGSGTPTTTAVSGTLDLRGAVAGSWEIRLRYPTGFGASSTFPFRVLSNTAVITSTPSPAGGPQGTDVAVTLTVSNLNPPGGGVAGVTVLFSGSPDPLVPTQPQAGKLTVSLPLRGLAAGVYTLAVKNPNAVPSNPVTFTVAPGQPALSGLACQTAGAACTNGSPLVVPQQAAKVPIVLSGSNFARPDPAGNNGTAVHVFAGCTPAVNAQNQVTCVCPTSPAPPVCVTDYVVPVADTSVDTAGTMTVQLDTLAAPMPLPGTGDSATFSVWVWNPGGSPSPQRSNRLLDAIRITRQ